MLKPRRCSLPTKPARRGSFSGGTVLGRTHDVKRSGSWSAGMHGHVLKADPDMANFAWTSLDVDNSWASPENVHVKNARGADENVFHEHAVLTNCTHPNVITCFGASEDGKELRLEAADQDLYEHIFNSHTCALPGAEVKEIARQLSNALSFIHRKGYSHNDIKCENIVMVESTPKFIDFEHATHVTAERNTTWGTKAYMSPEKFNNVADFDTQAADMYALGVTLHLAALSCFPNGTVDALPVLQSDWDSQGCDLDPDLVQILDGLLKADPAERWTADQLVDKLSGVSDAVNKVSHSVSLNDLTSISTEGTDCYRIPSFQDVLRSNLSTQKTQVSALSSSPLPSPLVSSKRDLYAGSPLPSPMPSPSPHEMSPQASPQVY